MGKLIIKVEENNRKVAEEPCLKPCPIERGMRIIGGKWKGSILWHLKDGPVRFNDLARQLAGASKKVLTEKLKEMEENKLITREVINEKPIAVSYKITDLGKSALSFLDQLVEWVLANDL